jgi:carbamate kinase
VAQTALIAVGGNSLILDEKHKTIPDQYLASVETCKHIAAMIEMGWNVVVTHGNGPQVGFILRRSEMARSELHDVPLEYCVADSQGGSAIQDCALAVTIPELPLVRLAELAATIGQAAGAKKQR